MTIALFSQILSIPSTSGLSQKKLVKTTKPKVGIYSDTDSEDEKTVKPRPPPVVTPIEKPKSPERVEQKPTSFDDLHEDLSASPLSSPKPPRTPGRESPPPKRSTFDLDRIYSDSEEEREYQEKRRRNTEYMELIEREYEEEQRRRKEQEARKSPLPEKAPSPSEPTTPSTTTLPPTPGASIVDKLADFKEKKPKATKASKAKTTPKVKEPTAVNGVQSTLPPTPSTDFFSTDDDEAKRNAKASPTSSDGGSSQASQVALDHCYSLPPSASPSMSTSPYHASENKHFLAHDHGYPTATGQTTNTVTSTTASVQPAKPGRPKKEPGAPKSKHKKRVEKLDKTDKGKLVDRKSGYMPAFQHAFEMFSSFRPVAKYRQRDASEEYAIANDFLTRGIDQEDIKYFRQSYEMLLQQDNASLYWLNNTHWIDHCPTYRPTAPPPVKRKKKDKDVELKVHATGSARTEGFYKIDQREKAKYKYHHLKGTAAASHIENKAVATKMQGISREARSNQRRLLTAFGAIGESELLKFNQLKFRKKHLKFAKSAIHDWGLFAMEPIAADEMVIEYVGQMIRPSVADLRETKYEAIGIGSSYLFRIDMETIIDATKCGNLARFINHSCNVSIKETYLLVVQW
jgi:histone-lysine N-methyltransferase SETD1